jgi:hypothetical protein
MSRSGSFGVNYKKTYGTAPSINEAVLGDLGTNPEGEYVFIKASATINQYDVVSIDSSYNATSIQDSGAYTTSFQVGIAQVALASSEYGWVWIGGAVGGGLNKGIKVNIASTGSTAATALYTTATAGKLSLTSSAHSKINNLFAISTVASTGTTEVQSTGYLSVN